MATTKRSQAPLLERLRRNGRLRKKEYEIEGYSREVYGIDYTFLFIVFVLVALGTLMVFSASYAYAKEQYSDSYYFAVKQIIWVAVGAAVMLAMTFLDYLWIWRFHKLIFYVSMIMMALVPFFGYEAKGATRWFMIGPLNFQPSEIAKLAIILFFADYIGHGRKTRFAQYIPYFAVAIYMTVTLVLQPHISCCIIVLLLIFTLMIFGNVSKKIIYGLMIAGAIGVIVLAIAVPHSRIRILTWLYPERYPDEAWQPLQSLYAIGSGGFWGVGLGQSTQKHLYLPEPQNDYIFSIACEELGLVFAIGVIFLFLALVWRGIYIAKHAPSNYSCLVVVGIIAQVAIQAFLNIGVVTNSLPSTGVSLPFFSYGGTSLIILMAEMGMILNISRYRYVRKEETE
ncbi:MAG: cell division protein FtsW [Clostridia bacterium]|nr:cell division protein FtsW [Clostridia bacterium]